MGILGCQEHGLADTLGHQVVGNFNLKETLVLVPCVIGGGEWRAICLDKMIFLSRQIFRGVHVEKGSHSTSVDTD